MEHWIWLCSIRHVGPVSQKKLLTAFGTPERIYQASSSELQEVKGISQRVRDAVVEARSLEKCKRILERVQKEEIWLLPRDDPLYPSYARDLPESPALLYYKGLIRPLTPSVAIVGSRNCTVEGKRAAEELSYFLSKRNIPVISGLAKGIDRAAHALCLVNRGVPIAFIASGVDYCYPKEHRSLYEAIIENGAVISQYAPGTPPTPKQFIQRNALISAWSSHVVVIEAGVKSGALSTAHFAQKHKRKLFMLPRSDARSELIPGSSIVDGCHPYPGVSAFEAVLNHSMHHYDK
ncbi:DNA-processing protein DprA [Guptibacillus algicola]|uniref:DNA-processing protein DprA n=1 Tax=Guptibacillus algicola TaxID=225844 RepID=UPI001CD54944|nr:DNA-protecting protein DprA [Alkalihalobacillus algicola]MCA0987103.1 DNA-processing protein DprA [Alkalihalobacillus algicola]